MSVRHAINKNNNSSSDSCRFYNSFNIMHNKYNNMKPCHNTTVPSTSITMHSNNLHQDMNYIFQVLNNDNAISVSSSGDWGPQFK